MFTDLQSFRVTGQKSMAIQAASSDVQHQPSLLVPYTLKIRSGCEGGGKGALVQKDKSATLGCTNDQSVAVPSPLKDGILYLVRKLTPTECASLQGFPKDWCSLVDHRDSAEYKMWGNGMTLPVVLYIFEGMSETLQKRYLEDLFKENKNAE